MSLLWFWFICLSLNIIGLALSLNLRHIFLYTLCFSVFPRSSQVPPPLFSFLLSGPSLSSHLGLGCASQLVLFLTSHARTEKVPQRLPAESWIVLPHSRRMQVQAFKTHAKSHWKCQSARHKRLQHKSQKWVWHWFTLTFNNSNSSDTLTALWERVRMCASPIPQK